MKTETYKWIVCFSCRQIGAIGVFQRKTWEVEAPTLDEAVELARVKAYETHEHLHLAWAEKRQPQL